MISFRIFATYISDTRKTLYNLAVPATKLLPRYGIVTDYNPLSESNVAIVIVISAVGGLL